MEDLDLIWTNCFLYNGKDSDISLMAKHLKNSGTKNFNQINQNSINIKPKVSNQVKPQK